MDGSRYQYLNLDLDWPGFTTAHLELGADGSLTLARTPLIVSQLSAPQEQPAPPSPSPAAWPAGIAVSGDCACDLYIADPLRNLIWRFDACVGEPQTLPYLQGPGSSPGQITTPRGLAVLHAPAGQLLCIADSGNNRIQVVDLLTQQVMGVWGQPDPYGTPTPGSDPGRLNDPWDLAADRAGNLYVVDHGNFRVQKFGPRGQVDPTFWSTVAAQSSHPGEPARVAVAGPAGAELVYVLDRDGERPGVTIFDTAGALQPGGSWPVADVVPDPIALAATPDAVYVGGSDGTLARFSPAGQLVSTIQIGGPIAALALGCEGELLVGGGGLPVKRLSLEGGYIPSGYFYAGPFQSIAPTLAWHRWRVLAEPLDPNAHLQLFTYSSTSSAGPPLGGSPDQIFDAWLPQPPDELDVPVLSMPVRQVLQDGPPADPAQDQEGGALETTYFWLGGRLRGDGQSSPLLRQMRIDYAPATSIRYLPAIYREGVKRRLFLDLLLGALGSELGRVDEILSALPALFDPAAAPSDWLPWLASWLDFDLIEDWPEADKRRYIADAVRLYGLRGTADGLRQYLKLYAGVEARIEEPLASASLFALDENVALGFNTMLAPAHEQGAVLASTATIGQSHLLDEQDMGVPLFEDVAHRFCVQVYGVQVIEPHVRDLVTQALEREKPAHCDYHLCVIEADMRVGFQARIGIDSIVAGPAGDLQLGDAAALGTDTVLANQPRQPGRRLGNRMRVGATL